MILPGGGVKDHFSAILGEEAGDENVVGMGEDVARGVFIAYYGGPEEGCYGVRPGTRDIEEEGLEEVGEASIGEEKRGDIHSSLEVGGNQEQELVGEGKERHMGRFGGKVRQGWRLRSKLEVELNSYIVFVLVSETTLSISR